MLSVPKAQGSSSRRGGGYCTFAVRVPASGAPYVPRTAYRGTPGGGPVGLEAAVACRLSGFGVTVCEKGQSIGSAVKEWGHVRLFSANSINCSPHGLYLCRSGLKP